MNKTVDPHAIAETQSVSEAPLTGSRYGRVNAAWDKVTEEAPSDFKSYGRNNETWVEVSGSDLDFGTGLTKDETQTPPIVHLQPATDFSIGGLKEPPQDGFAYSRQFDPTLPEGWKWALALTAGLQITSIIPDKAIYGPGEPLLTVHAYGTQFTQTTVVRVDGVDTATSYVSATELTFVMNPAVPISPQFHIITVYDTAATPPEGLGAEQFDFIKASTEVDYGKGLSLDTAPTPPIVNLDPAGPTNLGGVFVPLRSATQGLVIDMGDAALGDPATGELTAPLATPLLAGSIVEPPADAKGYVRTTQLDGTSQWVPPASTDMATHTELGTVRVPARNDHNQGLNLDSNGFLFAPPATPEHLGTITEPQQTGKHHARMRNATTGRGEWVEVEGGMEEPPMEPVALWARSSGGARGWLEIPESQTGGMEEPPADPVAIWGRSSAGARGWLEVPSFDHLTGFVEKIGDTMTGFLTLHAPPIYPLHAATKDYVDLSEPQEAPHNGKQYVRQDGQWVEVEIPEDGMEEPPANPVAIWGRSSAGDRGWLEVPSFDHLTGFVEKIGDTMTGKLTLDGPPVYPLHAATKDYVDLNDIGEAPVDGKLYGRSRAHWEEVPPPGIQDAPPDFVYGRTAQRWIQLNSDGTFPPASLLYVQVNGDTMKGSLFLAHEGALAMEAVTVSQLERMQVEAGVGLRKTANRIDLQPASEVEIGGLREPRGPGQFARTSAGAWEPVSSTPPVTYGIGINLDGDVVNLQPATGGDQAGAPEIGGVYGTKRSERNGIEIDPQGHISAPLATDKLAGSIVEPPADQKGYVRASQADGSWQWVPPADTTVRIATVSELGVVKVPARGLMTGLDIDSQGNLTAPKATHEHLGTILEPPGTGVQFARFRDPVTGINSWVPSAGGVIISDTPPPNPVHGMLWWESDSGDLFVYYDDGTSAQWVEAMAGAEPGVVMHVSDTPPDPMVAKPKDLWFDSDSGALAINYQDVDSTQWVQIGGSSGAAGGIAEAPIDGVAYSRQDATWVAATAGGGIADAPADGSEYLRKDNAWVNPTATGGFTQADADLLYEPINTMYTKAESDAKYFPFAGGTITGNVTVNGVATFANHVNVGTAAALRNLSLHGYLLVTDDQQLYLDGPGPVNTSSKGILLRKSATESAILHGRICSRSDSYSQGIIEFQLNNQANGVVGSVFFNGGLAGDRWANFSAMSVQCNDVFETSMAADKTEIRDVQKAEVDTAWKTLKPKKFRRKYAENNTTGPLRYGFVMEDMADELTKKRPPSESQGNTSGYSIGQVLALTVAKLKEVEAELAALKAKVK